jgi:hypothetical protein
MFQILRPFYIYDSLNNVFYFIQMYILIYCQVKVERYYTPEQRKVMEKKQKEEEERRARERGDNARERALNQMMGGVLEIKKEDELKKVG